MNHPYLTTTTPKTNAERLKEWREKRTKRKPLEVLFAELEAELERFESLYRIKKVVPCE